MIVSGPPSYSPYGYKSQPENLNINNSSNSFWKTWGVPSVILGSALLLFGIAMLPIEVARILRGSLNRGEKGSYFLYPNYNADSNFPSSGQILSFLPDLISGNTRYRLDNKGVVPFSATSNQGVNNFPIQGEYLWPWSHAALLFLLVTVAAGGLGILSGCRRTYSSIFAFFTLSLLSALLAIFLIAYYSVHVHWQLNHNSNLRKSNWFSNTDYSLGAAMLALSCGTFFLSSIAALYSALSLSLCCKTKGKYPTNYNPQYVPIQNAVGSNDQIIGIKPPPRLIPIPIPVS